MSRSIKVSEETYNKLIGMKHGVDCFDDVIKRMLEVWEMLSGVKDILGPHHWTKGRPLPYEAKQEATQR